MRGQEHARATPATSAQERYARTEQYDCERELNPGLMSEDDVRYLTETVAQLLRRHAREQMEEVSRANPTETQPLKPARAHTCARAWQDILPGPRVVFKFQVQT